MIVKALSAIVLRSEYMATMQRNDASQGCIVLPPDRTAIPSGEIIRVIE